MSRLEPNSIRRQTNSSCSPYGCGQKKHSEVCVRCALRSPDNLFISPLSHGGRCVPNSGSSTYYGFIIFMGFTSWLSEMRIWCTCMQITRRVTLWTRALIQNVTLNVQRRAKRLRTYLSVLTATRLRSVAACFIGSNNNRPLSLVMMLEQLPLRRMQMDLLVDLMEAADTII